MCGIGNLQEIYKRLQDDESKMIYISRLNYSVTQDVSYLREMVGRVMKTKTVWQNFLDKLVKLSEKRELVIFGAGMWGNILYRETCGLVPWKCMVDSNPVERENSPVPILPFQQFVDSDQGEYIVLSSFKNLREMKGQLRSQGIPDDRIIDAGSVIYQLTEKAIYFDLEELLPCKSREVFVDAGCFDGETTRQFLAWCGGSGYSYCLEPDACNIALIQKNLGSSLNFEIMEKAIWSKTTRLSIDAKGNCATSVTEQKSLDDQKGIEAVALDDILLDKGVTFIKMDIEGAEVEALHGAGRILSEQKPRLVISIYHKPDDIWTIPRTILSYHSGYKFYLRHYSFSDYDTVLYAIP